MADTGKQTPSSLSVCAVLYASLNFDVLIEVESDILELTKRDADGVVKLLRGGVSPNDTEKVTVVSAATTSQGKGKTESSG